MPSLMKTLFAVTCLMPLAACSLWGDDEEEVEVQDPQLLATQQKVPVQSVARVEIGRTRDGFLVSAFGTAPGLGYSAPELRVRRGGEPAGDGYLEFDFIAAEPIATNLPPGTVRARAIRADLPIQVRQLRGVLGIRILALGGGVQVPVNRGG